MVWHKKLGPAQNILGPVKGQGIRFLLNNLVYKLIALSVSSGDLIICQSLNVEYWIICSVFYDFFELLKTEIFLDNKDKRFDFKKFGSIQSFCLGNLGNYEVDGRKIHQLLIIKKHIYNTAWLFLLTLDYTSIFYSDHNNFLLHNSIAFFVDTMDNV